jgi:hypothetical protein
MTKDRRDPLGVLSERKREVALALMREAQRMANAQPSTFPFASTLERIGVLLRAAIDEMEAS